jgi:tail protein P2 I
MSEAPLTTQVGGDLYDALEPLTYADERLGWPLANFGDALALILEETAQLVRADDEGNDGWSAFADPQRCPSAYLYTLAQWAGVRYPRRMSEAHLRELIGPRAPGLWRGTKEALIDTVQRYLTPDGSIYFEERADGDPYKLRISTFVYDTLNEAAIRRELTVQVPAGLILDYRLIAGISYAILRRLVVSYAEMRTKFATYEAVRTYVPPP